MAFSAQTLKMNLSSAQLDMLRKRIPAELPATLPQREFIAGLCKERKFDDVRHLQKIVLLMDVPFEDGGLKKNEAGDIITWLKTLPKRDKNEDSPAFTVVKTGATVAAGRITPAANNSRPAANTATLTTALKVGLYVGTGSSNAGLFYRVRMMKKRNYDRHITIYETIDRDGYTRRISSAIGARWSLQHTELRPATADEARKASLKFKRCMICGKKLRVEESVERGIGPVCLRIINTMVGAA